MRTGKRGSLFTNHGLPEGLTRSGILPIDTPRHETYARRPDLTTKARPDDVRVSKFPEGSDIRLTEIKLKKGEPVDKALRRLKKKIDREGTLKEVRNHRRYEKPSEKKRRKMKVARFTAMLKARYADL